MINYTDCDGRFYTDVHPIKKNKHSKQNDFVLLNSGISNHSANSVNGGASVYAMLQFRI